MKALITTATATLTLLLAGCGSEGGETGNVATAANAGAIEQIPAPNGGDWTQVVSTTPEGGFIMGNPDAPVKLVEYASMTCPHCAVFSREASEALKNEYVKSGQVSFEFRNFVLNGIDMAASLLARCQGPGPFFQLTEQVFAQQDQWMQGFQELPEATAQQLQSLPPEQQISALAEAGDLYSFFQMRGLPQSKAQACVSDQQAVEQLVQMGQRATDQGIQGTPTFMINGEVVEGIATWDQLEPRIRGAIG